MRDPPTCRRTPSDRVHACGLATWGTAAIALTASETACFASSSVSLPVDTSKTIGLTPFCGGGQRSSKRSLVASLSVPAREWRAHHEPSERRQGKPRPEDPRSPDREQGGGIDTPDLGWVFTGPDPRGFDYACLRREVFLPGARADEVVAPPLAGIDRDRVSLWWRGHAGGLAGAHEYLEHGQAHDHGREGPPEPLHGDLVAPGQGQHAHEDDDDAQPPLVAPHPAPRCPQVVASHPVSEALESRAQGRAECGAVPVGAGEAPCDDQQQSEREQDALPTLEVGEQGVVEDLARGTEDRARELVDEQLAPDREAQGQQDGVGGEHGADQHA